MRRALILILMLCVPAMCFGADPFKDIVKAIEREYGVRHTGIPWFARVIIKPALWGSGVSGLKLAEFEHGSFRGEARQGRIARVIETTVGPEWQQIIRVRSRSDNETTYIYVRPQGTRFVMLIASIDADEASVVQMTLNPDQFQKWADDTNTMARSHLKRSEGKPVEAETLVSSNTPGGYGILIP